jgi:hypothetical protein
MPKIKKPPPYFMKHLVDRSKFTLAGEGEVPKTFLTPGMVPHGTEVY